jgi:exodeoxyribonuclease VII small subunit
VKASVKLIPEIAPEVAPDFVYESALLRLRAIVEALQQPDLPLTKSVALHHEGQALLTQCRSYLAAVGLVFDAATPDPA